MKLCLEGIGEEDGEKRFRVSFKIKLKYFRSLKNYFSINS